MRAFLISCVMLLAAGCSDPVADAERRIRENLATRGEVLEVVMTQQGEGRMGGFARVRTHQGREVRLTCTAERGEDVQVASWRCLQQLDAVLLEEVETAIRNSFAPRGTVLEVEMARRDDEHLAGHALVRTAPDLEQRFECSAERTANGSFDWRCMEPTAPADAAEAG
ncbi:MAG: hypothetical protein ACXWU1_11930 [Allosphingosinicella sp.]